MERKRIQTAYGSARLAIIGLLGMSWLLPSSSVASQHRHELHEFSGVYLVQCHKDMGRAFAVVGGAFVGMISVGLAELQDYHLVAKCRVPSPVAIGTSIFVVVVTVPFASAGHIYEFATEGKGALSQVMNVAVFTVPGVLIGGQLGPRLQARVNPDFMKVGISVLFIGIGAFMLTTLFAF